MYICMFRKLYKRRYDMYIYVHILNFIPFFGLGPFLGLFWLVLSFDYINTFKIFPKYFLFHILYIFFFIFVCACQTRKKDIIVIKDEIYKDTRIYSTNQATGGKRGQKILFSQSKTYSCIQYSYRIRISVDFSMVFIRPFGSLN